MLLYEQELSFRKISLKEIIRKLSQQENEINLEDNIIINYFGDRNKLKKYLIPKKNTFKNTLLFINYKEIYIGGVNLLDINIREKFGLNKYSPNSFYLGQWKNNEKEGIGFLKVNEAVEYMGNFSRNQINGYGMSFYRENEVLYIGNYLEGKFEEGIYYNKNDILYKGKIINGKNDDFCSFIELEKGRIFIGKALDDIFIKGYLGICEYSEINEDECNDSKIMELTKIIYFDKSDFNDIKIIHYTSFTKEFYNKIQDIMGNIIQVNYNMKAQCENLIDYFQSFDSYVNDRDYIDYLIKINQIDNEESLENYFLRDFQDFCKKFDVNEKEYNSQNIVDIIQPPDIINV